MQLLKVVMVNRVFQVVDCGSQKSFERVVVDLFFLDHINFSNTSIKMNKKANLATLSGSGSPKSPSSVFLRLAFKNELKSEKGVKTGQGFKETGQNPGRQPSKKAIDFGLICHWSFFWGKQVIFDHVKELKFFSVFFTMYMNDVDKNSMHQVPSS